MRYETRHDLLPGRTVWVVRIANRFDGETTLLLSKVSEAVLPNTPGNHVGEGATMEGFLQAQPGVRLLVNGGFNHYRRDFYSWPHQRFQVGDPVGLVKIRHHLFDDVLDASNYGFFVQQDKCQPWRIVGPQDLDRSAKYILGCTPLLMAHGAPTALPVGSMTPVQAGLVNPPSVLGHGLQLHPRTAVGIDGEELVFIVVEGGACIGCTLPELQQLGVALELDSLLNLDGGGSSQLRLHDGTGWVQSYVEPQDTRRVLGNVIVLFDETLKRVSAHAGSRASCAARA